MALPTTTALEEANGVVRDENATLRDENATLRDENATLRDENATLKAEIATLMERVRLAETAANTTAPPTNTAAHAVANWAVDRATGLPEVWALVATHLGLVGAWRLMRVCKAARVGAKEYLSTLPGLVVCGGYSAGSGGLVRDVWRLDLATLRWGGMPGLVTARYNYACCVVRGKLVVLSGQTSGGLTSSVEMLSSEEGAFVDLPPLPCGGIQCAAAIAVEESDSAAGQVLLLGRSMGGGPVSTAHLVDLATGVCTPGRPDLLRSRYNFAAAGLPGGRQIVCAGGRDGGSSADMWGPPVQGAPDAAWTWRHAMAMSVASSGCRGCVMSDGRFAVLGGGGTAVGTSSCEALAIGDDDAHWEPLLPMHDARDVVACSAVGGCVIVAGGWRRKSAEVFDEVLGRWLWLPRDLTYNLAYMGSALL
jgi:hypothetical protein